MRDPRCPWQPSHGGPYTVRRRGRFFRRMAALSTLVVLLSVWGLCALAWMALTRLGLVDASTPVMPFLIVAAWFGGFVVIGFLRMGRGFGSPLRAIMDAADRVASGDYAVRVPSYGPPPIRALAQAFNTMTERLERNDRLRRNLMADVAHELRTPLTVIQGRVEGLLDGVYARDDRSLEQVLEETRVLSRLIEDLRTLALSEAGALKLQKETTDVAGLARDVAQAFADQAASQRVSIDVKDAGVEAIEVDPVRMREVLSNLVSNAVRHAGAGGTVTVNVAPAAGGVTVSVHDTGPGMTPEETARAFDRFYKGPESRGAGLGLAIARGLVLAHQGDISIASEPGHGTTITLVLPQG